MSEGVIVVQVFEVGGHQMIPGGDLTELAVEGDWKNMIDGAVGNSTATVKLAYCDDPDPRIDYITPFLHELRISLDGDIVFDGPIFWFAAQISKGAQIVAYDMSAWFSWREVLDTFDWSTGAPIDTIIKALIKSAIQGGPSWPDFDFMGIMDYLTVKSIPKIVNRQNGSLTHTPPFSGTTFYAQGARPLTDPHEIVWDAYLSFFVGKQVHMACQGRRIFFWPYGTSLQQLPVASVADFTDFPNLVRDGSKFVTSATCQVRTNSLTAGDLNVVAGSTSAATGISAATGDSSFVIVTSGASPFYVGQILSSDSSLTMPIGSQFEDQLFHPAVGPNRSYSSVDIDQTFIGPLAVGTNINGEVFGHAGGKHPLWPVLVARERSEPDVVGQDQAAIIAASMIQLEVPFDSLDVGEFDISVTEHLPWEFAKIVPGYTALVTTRLGSINLQVAMTSGKWTSSSSGPKLDLVVGLRTLPAPPGTLPDNRVYAEWDNNTLPVPPVVAPTNTVVRPNRNRARRTGDINTMAPIFFGATGRPIGWFVPPATFVGCPTGGDVTALQAASPGYFNVTVSPQFYDLLIVACQQGAGF